MQPKPAFFCVNGDMITSGSTSFGTVPDSMERQTAISELKLFKNDTDLLNPNIRLILTLGNHDTHPQEVEPKMFWEVFSKQPAYQSFNQSGVHIIFLNGHSTGYIDVNQLVWLINDVDSIQKKQTVIVFIHQPAMANRVNERGIPKAISEAFKRHVGMVWLIAGHGHSNGQKVFQLKKSKLIEHRISFGSENLWGGTERPGFWIYCLENGQVAGRIFKQQNLGYRIEEAPDLRLAEKVPIPFDHLRGMCWKHMVGNGDSEFLIEAKAKDCLNYWAYVKMLIYRFPLKETGNHCSRFAMLCNYNKIKNLNQEGQYLVSSDLKNWQEINLEKAEFDVMIFRIPETLQQVENIYFKFIPLGETNVGGFALLK